MSVLSGWFVKNKWNALFGVWALHGIFALAQFLASQNSPFDLSVEEVVLGGTLLFWVVLNLFLIFSLSRKSSWLTQSLRSLKNSAVRDRIFVFAVFVLFAQVCLGILRSIADRTSFWYVGYLDRLSPLLNLTAVILAEVIALILFTVLREKAEDKKSLKSFSAKLLFVLVLLAGTVFYISQTGMGIAPIYKGDWARGLPAVPLFEWQILLACLFCAGMVIAESNEKILKIPRLDLWISLAVWLATVTLWLGQPIVPNSSALEPRAPNFEVYPFSDAQTYDEFSQSVLIGNGFGTDKIPQRPLYIVFLTFLHVLVGQNYENVIALQSMLFALFPVLLYLFGREFFGRPIGISIALLAILRDYTSNFVSPFTGNLSYSKLYLSEIPTAMLLILFLLVGMRWIKSEFPAFSGFFMGGILGVAMLIRTQVLVAFPMLLLFAFLVQPKKVMPIIKGALLALVTIVLVISPWLWRNWQMTGELIFDNPESQMANLALRYSRLNGVDVDIMPLPGEANSEYNARLTELATRAINLNPTAIATGIANSFLNHGVNNILVLPLRNNLRNFGELWMPTDAFWQGWDGKPTFSQGVILVFYVFLFGLGLSAAWHRNGWLGFLPLGVNLVYNLWTSLALLSGQRFMLTMDWSIYLYYMIGLFALLNVFLFALERGRSVILQWREASLHLPLQQPAPKGWRHYIFAGLLFWGIGASLPLAEKVFPVQYPPLSQSELAHALLASPSLYQVEPPAACLQEMSVRDDVSFLHGRALYPRYYEANGGESFTDSFGYKIADEGRLVFTLLGQSTVRVVFPMNEAPLFFPHASDVTLVYGKDGDIWFALVEKEGSEAFYVSNSFDISMCR